MVRGVDLCVMRQALGAEEEGAKRKPRVGGSTPFSCPWWVGTICSLRRVGSLGDKGHSDFSLQLPLALATALVRESQLHLEP